MRTINKASLALIMQSIVISGCLGPVSDLSLPEIARGLNGRDAEQEDELARRVIAKLGLDGPEQEFIEGLESLGFTPLSSEKNAEFQGDELRPSFGISPPRVDLLPWKYADYSIGVFPCGYSWTIRWRELDGTILYVDAIISRACI